MRSAEHSARELGSRTARQRLPIQGRPYFAHVQDGLSLGYRRGKRGGSWVGRAYDTEHGYRFSPLGKANDLAEGVGLSFQKAQDEARNWYAQLALADANGVTLKTGWTVKDAAQDWLEHWTGTSERSKATSEGNVRHHILPTLGRIEVAKLTRETIQKWLLELSKKPPVKVLQRQDSTKKLPPSQQSKIVYDPHDQETRRKRRESANRVFRDLRSLLNRAYENDKVVSNKAWASVAELDTPKARTETLSLDEAKRFITACDPDFLILAQAALITGCRYKDVCNLRVSAFDPQQHAVRVKQSKTGEWQQSYLTDEEEHFFVMHIDGKKQDDHIFLRNDGKPWGKSHQQQRMKDALAAAQITKHIRFHDLRHSLGRWLAETGTNMKVISKQLGHSSIKVTEEFYVEFTPDYMAKAVRATKPSILQIASS